MSSVINNLVSLDCTYHKISSVVLGIIGVIILIIAVLNVKDKSSMSGKATGTLSNVVTTSSVDDKGHVQYSVVMNVVYGSNVSAVLTSSNNIYANGQKISILFDPAIPTKVAIESEYVSPARIAIYGIYISISCIICCIMTYIISSTTWGCRLMAFSNAVDATRHIF